MKTMPVVPTLPEVPPFPERKQALRTLSLDQLKRVVGGMAHTSAGDPPEDVGNP